MENYLDALMRWLHFFPAIVMIGGAIGGPSLGQPAVAPLARSGVISGIVLLLVTGTVNMVNLLPTVPKGWHMWFGIKFLLALHVFAMLFLMTKPDAPVEKRLRWQKLALFGTVGVVLAGVYLRHLRAA